MFFYYFLSKRFLENYQGARLGNNFLPVDLILAALYLSFLCQRLLWFLGFYKGTGTQ